MKDDFNLSNWITKNEVVLKGWIHEDNVKEFIRRLKDVLHELHDEENDFSSKNYVFIKEQIDKLAGDKLI